MKPQGDTIVIVCGHIARDERPIQLVVHHGDDGWQLACGDYDHPEDMGDAATVHLHHLTARQANLADALNIDSGYLAEWSDGHWSITAHDD